jgi:hypothetical protein
MTAPGQIFMARAWAETFTTPDDRENVVEYVRADVAEAAVAAAVQAERARCAALADAIAHAIRQAGGDRELGLAALAESIAAAIRAGGA